MNNEVFIGVVEWDGKKPPKPWYQRLARMGLTVSGTGDKKQDIVERRMTFVDEVMERKTADAVNGTGAVILQEGTFIVGSYQLARLIASLAHELGARHVSLFEGAKHTGEFTMSQTDLENLNRLNKVHGRKGRPPGDKADYSVSCFDEAMVFSVRDVYDVSNCPNCHSPNIKRRVGEPRKYRLPRADEDMLTYWLQTRFSASEQYEIPLVSKDGDEIPTGDIGINPRHEDEIRIINMISDSDEFLAQIGTLSPKAQLDVLDAVFCARMFHEKEVRNKARISTLTECFARKADPGRASFNESAKNVDILDAAPVLGVSQTTRYYMRLVEGEKIFA